MVTCLGIRPVSDTTGYEKAVHWEWSLKTKPEMEKTEK